MKKIFSLILLFFIPISYIFSAEVKGIIITKTDTTHVTFNIPMNLASEPTFVNLQYKIKYVDAAGNKCKLYPNQAKEIQFTHNNTLYRMQSKFDNLSPNSDGESKIFLKLEIDGKIKLFSYYIRQTMTTGGGPNSVPMTTSSTYSKYILQKGNNDLVRYGKMNFNLDMPVFLKECPDLVKKIEDKTYHRNDIEAIITYYNSNCAN